MVLRVGDTSGYSVVIRTSFKWSSFTSLITSPLLVMTSVGFVSVVPFQPAIWARLGSVRLPSASVTPSKVVMFFSSRSSAVTLIS